MRKLKNSELKRIEVEEFRKTPKTPLIVILDNIRSLNNIGSVFRTSDAFLIKKIYLCGITAKPPNKDIHKTALGATESVDWEYVGDALALVRGLQMEGIKVIAVEQADKSTDLRELVLEEGTTYAVVFGNEVKGVQQEVVSASDLCLEIPQYGTKHSLNISVSCGIVLWEMYRKLCN